MTLSVKIIPKSRMGLQLQLNSIFRTLLLPEMKRQFAGAKKTDDKDLGEIVEDYLESQIKEVSIGLFKNADSLQYDPVEKQLFAQSKVFDATTEIAPTSELLEHLAEHILVQLDDIQVAQKNDWDIFAAQKDARASGKLGNLISWVYGSMYFPLLGIRLMAVCYQLLLHKQVRAVLPLLFGKKAKRVLTFLDHRLIDPVAFHAHLRKRCREMWDDTTGRPDDGDPK